MTTVPAAFVARLHTVFAVTAFISAFIVGCALHYKKIVKNGVAQYPDEWIPSVSATIGDWFPERNVFQILIALASGPRLCLVLFQYLLHRSDNSFLPKIVCFFGLVRLLSCGGWVYVTSTDNHDVHDVMMILYIICNIPWMLIGTSTTPPTRVRVRRKRKFVASCFFATLVPLVYFFVQHKVHRIPGAYTSYAFCEWGLIFLDILYDSISEQEFRETGLEISLATKKAGSIEIHNLSFSAAPSFKTPSEQTIVSNNGVSLVFSAEQKTSPEEMGTRNWKPSVNFLADVYLSYVFWTLFTALIPSLFYFSVWQLSIGGSELAVFSVVSPALLSLTVPSGSSTSRTFLDIAKTRIGQLILRAVSLVGIAAYIVPSPLGRLLLVSAGNIAGMISQASLWAGVVEGQEHVGYQAIVSGLGVLLAVLSKQANRANNPIWPFINHKAGGWNKTGIFFAVLSIYDLSLRPIAPVAQHKHITSSQHRGVLQAALPIASLLFSITTLLGDSSTLIAWSWTGYEDGLPRGPVPHLHGSLTVIAMVFGLTHALYSTIRPELDFLKSHWWFMIGAVSTYVMYNCRNWLGYAGGLGVAMWLMSILPTVFEHAAEGIRGGTSVAKIYGVAMFIYCVLQVAGVFTVAYAFVPGGVYLRERTDLMLIFSLVSLLPAFKLPVSRTPPAMFSISPITLKYKPHIRVFLTTITLASLLTTLYRLPRASPSPYKPGPRIITSGIWTIHFGVDNEGHDSQRAMTNLIKDMNLDIVGLLETDLHRPAFGHRDISRLVVEEMNYNVDIGPGPNSHTWGAVLLSKFPIVSTKHHLLPSPNGELAPAIEAVLDAYGTEVLVIVAHNGQEEDSLDRELQSTELAKIMANSTRPTIFLGYVVSKPFMPRPDPYGILVTEGRMHDIDMDDFDRWCEYILYRGLYRTSYARVSRGIVTDTELQIGRFVLPKHGFNVTDDSVGARYIRSRKEDLPEAHWFPMDYYGNEDGGGVNGHFYHVFNTPLYYGLPVGAIV